MIKTQHKNKAPDPAGAKDDVRMFTANI